MGKLTEKIKAMFKDNNIDDPKTIKALEDEGRNEADKIAEIMGQTEDRTAFVPKVDVPPVDLEGCEINEFGEIIRKPKENSKDEKEDAGR